MPQYKTFQYGIHKYGRYRVSSDKNKTHFILLPARVSVYRQGKKETLYLPPPTPVRGQHHTFRLTSNQGERVYQKTVTLSGKYDRLRLNTNNTRTNEALIATRGWN